MGKNKNNLEKTVQYGRVYFIFWCFCNIFHILVIGRLCATELPISNNEGSTITLEQYRKAASLPAGGKEQEESLRQIIKADPHLVDPYVTLASLLSNEGRPQEAEEIIRMALKLRPNLPVAHKWLGIILASEGEDRDAVKEFQTASQFNPDDAEICMGLGDIDARHGDYLEAIYELNKALDLNPHENLARAANALLVISKAGLVSTHTNITLPENLTPQELIMALRGKLTQQDLQLVVNPLENNNEMANWAHDLTETATNETEKATILFDALIQHVNINGYELNRSRTAQEVFYDWKRPGNSFFCQEYAYLYVALARTVGLRAYDVFVHETCDGSKDWHACAAVSADNKTFLVDPEYRWLKVPHKQFLVLNDLQTIAIYLCYSPELQQRQIAAKLSPDLLPVQVNLLFGLINDGRWKKAYEELPRILKLDADEWTSDILKAEFAVHEGQPEQAANLLQKAVEINPASGVANLLLGDIFSQQSKSKEALESYQKALNCFLDKEEADHVLQAIGKINKANNDYIHYYSSGFYEQQAGDLDGALTNFVKAIELKPDYAEAFFGIGYVDQIKGDLDSALNNYSKAIELKPEWAEAYGNRGSVNQKKGNLDKALADYSKVIELNPKLGLNVASLFYQLACLYYDQQEFTNSLICFRKNIELDSNNDYTHLRVWLVRSKLGERDDATKELQEYLVNRKIEKPSDWPLKIGDFLTGKLSELELFKAAESLDQQIDAKRRCEAYFYAGSKRLIEGDKKTAGDYFEKCLSTGEKDFSEYESAVSELK